MFNSLIGNQMSAKYGIENPERLLQSQRDCRNLVIHLLKRSRKTIEKTSHHRDYIWDLVRLNLICFLFKNMFFDIFFTNQINKQTNI